MPNLSDKFSQYGISLATAQVEYLYNTASSTSADDTSSFNYGSQGQAILSFSSAGNWISRRVQSINALTPQDRITVEVSKDGNEWFDASQMFPPMESGSAKYGIDVEPQDSTNLQLNVRFGGNGANGTEAWSAYTAWFWRVRVTRANLSAGFGTATTTAAGLITLDSSAAATTSSHGLLPPVTSMSDVLATQLGHKQYLHGTTYNGGVGPTITTQNLAITTVHRGVFVPYQMQDGTWRLKFNLSFTGTSGTHKDIFVEGISAKATTDVLQAFSASADSTSSSPTAVHFLAGGASNRLVIRFSANTSGVGAAGDVELNAKPTWAY